MDISINSQTIARSKVQGVFLKPALGAYELCISLVITILNAQQSPKWALVNGATIRAKSASSDLLLGSANDGFFVQFEQRDITCEIYETLSFSIFPNQLAALERLRTGGDLEFEISLTGLGGEQQPRHAAKLNAKWKVLVSQSDWVKQLNQVHAANILLIEIPFSFLESAGQDHHIIKEVRKAHRHLQMGHYSECVSTCRIVLDQLSHSNGEESESQTAIYKALASKQEREAMSKDAPRAKHVLHNSPFHPFGSSSK